MGEETNGSERFLEFLQRKNIDAAAFAHAEPLVFEKWKSLFEQMHENSFVLQMKFQINPTRRKYTRTPFTSR